jgi:hypothetical protein
LRSGDHDRRGTADQHQAVHTGDLRKGSASGLRAQTRSCPRQPGPRPATARGSTPPARRVPIPRGRPFSGAVRRGRDGDHVRSHAGDRADAVRQRPVAAGEHGAVSARRDAAEDTSRQPTARPPSDGHRPGGSHDGNGAANCHGNRRRCVVVPSGHPATRVRPLFGWRWASPFCSRGRRTHGSGTSLPGGLARLGPRGQPWLCWALCST